MDWSKIDDALKTPEQRETEASDTERQRRKEILGEMIAVYKGWQHTLNELNQRVARFQASMGSTSKGDVSIDARGHSLKISFDTEALRILVQLDDAKDEIIYNRVKSSLVLATAQHSPIDPDAYFGGLVEQFVHRLVSP